MPTVHEIEEALFLLAPKAGAMESDNVGHLIGDPQQSVTRVLVALDITPIVVEEALERQCELVVSHHPVINSNWDKVQTIRTDEPKGKMLFSMARGSVSAICMHTNLDVASGGVNDCLAQKLGLQEIKTMENGLIRVGRLPKPMSLSDFARHVSRCLGCNGIRWSDSEKQVSYVAVGGGSCGEYEGEVLAEGCDTFVTADLKYHQFLDAPAKGINLVDAGHFPTEDPVCERLIQYLTERFPELIAVKSTSHKEVIQYYVEGD